MTNHSISVFGNDVYNILGATSTPVKYLSKLLVNKAYQLQVLKAIFEIVKKKLCFTIFRQRK